MKWLLFLLVLSGTAAYGQDDSTRYIWYRNQYGMAMPRLLADSAIHIPYRDTNFIPFRPGAIVMRPADKKFYGYTTHWVEVGSGGGSADSTLFATLFRLDTAKINLRTTIDAKLSKSDSALYYTKFRSDTSRVNIYSAITAATGINQLTGDVTAGPGTGSQAATIANNAVSNAKFRQSAGTSVVGRSANSTGNVADIVASVASTFLKRNSTSLLFDSVDYAELKNKPDLQNPGVYFGPAESFDPSFVVFASCIPRTANSYSNGADIEWLILDHATDHNSSFFDSVYGGGANQLIVRFPTVKNVLNTTITPDEALSGALTVMGTSTGLYQFDAYVWQPFSTSIRLTGNGTSSWTKNSDVSIGSYFDLSTISSGATGFNISTGVNISYDGIGIQYIGPNGYGIKRTYSGLGSYNASFTLIDAFGNPVTTNPTSADEIIMTNAGMGSRQLNMTTWRPENQFISTFANFWIFGAYECWLVAAPTSTSSIQVRWQNYPSASSYKIYRATSLYGSRTLIHNGGGNAVTDSGLSTGTVYYYFFVPVISGVDTEITHFRTNTK